MDLNKIMIIGRLTRDPELRSLPSGRAVCLCSVATGRQWTDAQGQKQKQTEFHNVVAWGKLAETMNQYLRKASRVYIEGRLQTRDWIGQDGVKRYRTELIADNMIMLDGRPSSPNGTAPPASAAPSAAESAPAPAAPAEEEIRVEDIPF